MKVNVISYGESLLHFEKDPGIITIGVNHIEYWQDVDWLLLVDPPHLIPVNKLKVMRQSRANKIFVSYKSWLDYFERSRCVAITLSAERGGLQDFYNENPNALIPRSHNSPFVAVCLAIRYGAKRVDLYGVDFNTDSAVGQPFHERNIIHFRGLYERCKKEGIELYCCPESRLAEFIPIIPELT